MCNPRRVEVTATRQIHEAWEREVERVAEATATLTGEARIQQDLDASLGGPALMALQLALDNGYPGWEEDGDIFRHEVEGGYVSYDPGERTLEIVATLSEELTVQGFAREVLRGTAEGEVEATGRGDYYDDNWGGRTEQKARQEAQRQVQSGLDQAMADRLKALADEEEKEQDEKIRGQAKEAAEAEWERRAVERREALSAQAQGRLRDVGVRARQAFHHLLAHAYREALVGMARRRGVADGDIRRSESDDFLEIEFMLP